MVPAASVTAGELLATYGRHPEIAVRVRAASEELMRARDYQSRLANSIRVKEGRCRDGRVWSL